MKVALAAGIARCLSGGPILAFSARRRDGRHHLGRRALRAHVRPAPAADAVAQVLATH